MRDHNYPKTRAEESVPDGDLLPRRAHPGVTEVIAHSAAGLASSSWMAELRTLLWRYADLGIIPDVGLMGLDELHGVYRFLARLEDAGDGEALRNELN